MSAATQLPEVLLETDWQGLPLRSRGKVRDIYEADETLLIVATDRISAFDCILPSGIPGKGAVLTQLSMFWFDKLAHVVENHVVASAGTNHPKALRDAAAQFPSRSMLVRRAEMIEVECVARGYLAGSGWKEYLASGTVCGIPLPAGLIESARLPEPIFTPATKAGTGHDENIPFARLVEMVGAPLADRLRQTTLELYRQAAVYAAERGILIADTKFEFGFIDGRLVLADEALTPDSSRFWPEAQYQPGGAQPSFDKQFVRDYLEASGWSKSPPAPMLPADVVMRTSEKYREAYRLLTGRSL